MINKQQYGLNYISHSIFTNHEQSCRHKPLRLFFFAFTIETGTPVLLLIRLFSPPPIIVEDVKTDVLIAESGVVTDLCCPCPFPSL